MSLSRDISLEKNDESDNDDERWVEVISLEPRAYLFHNFLVRFQVFKPQPANIKNHYMDNLPDATRMSTFDSLGCSSHGKVYSGR